jgi:RND superfamily putative drug exporter
LAAWVVTILGLGAGALTAGSGFTDSTDLPDSESAAAYSLLTDVGFGATSAGDAGVSGRIVWHSEGVAIDDPQLAQRVGEVLDAVTAMPGVQSVTSPSQHRLLVQEIPVRSMPLPTPHTPALC